MFGEILPVFAEKKSGNCYGSWFISTDSPGRQNRECS